MNLLGICGSLRQKSYNRVILNVVKDLLPSHVSFTVAEIGDIPLYNGDIEAQGFPESVIRLQTQIEQAAGVIIVTPEYNRSIPGVLKNAIDWASRPPKNVFAGKPFVITGASDGGFGTVRAQLHLREILSQRGSFVLPLPEVYISRVQDKVDTNLQLTDQKTKDDLQKLVDAFLNWIA